MAALIPDRLAGLGREPVRRVAIVSRPLRAPLSPWTWRRRDPRLATLDSRLGTRFDSPVIKARQLDHGESWESGESATYFGNHAYEANFIVEGWVVVELKAIAKIGRIEERQLLTYLKVEGFPLGYILNFGAPTLIEGTMRRVNNFPEGTPPFAGKSEENAAT